MTWAPPRSGAPRRGHHPNGEQGGDEHAGKRHPQGQDSPIDDDLDAFGQAHHVADGAGGKDDAGCVESGLLHWRSPSHRLTSDDAPHDSRDNLPNSVAFSVPPIIRCLH